VGTQAKLKAVQEPGSHQYRFIDRYVLKKFILKGVQKKLMFFFRGSRGETVRERAGRQREGKWNPRDEGNRVGLLIRIWDLDRFLESRS
jgi:hypothetical protein